MYVFRLAKLKQSELHKIEDSRTALMHFDTNSLENMILPLINVYMLLV